MNDHEEKLWKEIKEGNQSSFRKIYDQYYKYVITIVWRLTKDEFVAKDISQDVFVELWKRKDILTDEMNLKSYLGRSATNRSINYIKSNKTIGFDVNIHEEATGASEDSLMKVELGESTKIISHAIDSLPEKCRIIFSLSRYENLSNKEISDKLDISMKTVENQITIAIKKIRQCLVENQIISAIITICVFLSNFFKFFGG